MLHRLEKISALILGGLIGGCSQQPPTPPNGNTSSSPDTASQSAGTAATPGVQPVVGGYMEVSSDSPEVIVAAAYAIETHSKQGASLTLKSITSAQLQVVAGMNYKLTLSVEEAGTPKTAETVVYQNLQNEKSLTSWEWKPVEPGK